MKTLIFVSLLLCSVKCAFSQKILLSVDDLIVVTFKLTDKIMQDKCSCGMEVIQDTKTCILGKITIDEVLCIRDSSVFSPDSLQSIKYCVFSSVEDIKLGQTYLGYFSHSSSKMYLVLNRKQEAWDSNGFSCYRPAIYVKGLHGCHKVTLWQRIQLKMGIRKQKIFDKVRSKSKKRDRYEEHIHSRGKT